jgi:hypothetical protein
MIVGADVDFAPGIHTLDRYDCHLASGDITVGVTEWDR